jgi:hypothetical protein
MKHRRPQKFSIGHAVLALGVGALLGSFLIGLLFNIQGISPLWNTIYPKDGMLLAIVAVVISLFGTTSTFALLSLPFFCIGLIVFAVPAWCLLHYCGFQKKHHAMITGFLLTASTAGFIFFTGPFMFLLCGIIGACVGATIWQMTYGRALHI